MLYTYIITATYITGRCPSLTSTHPLTHTRSHVYPRYPVTLHWITSNMEKKIYKMYKGKIRLAGIHFYCSLFPSAGQRLVQAVNLSPWPLHLPLAAGRSRPATVINVAQENSVALFVLFPVFRFTPLFWSLSSEGFGLYVHIQITRNPLLHSQEVKKAA